ncbi:hypothetical protein DFH09DRAFT_1303138 [Mycena vulgaris]|nr:hypothetical protein DFH09DRAFT_1303138 [Mycena vulgaris]
MRAVWERLKEPRKKTAKKKAKSTLKISTAHSSRLALVSEQDELSDHSDSGDGASINSPIPSPKPWDDESERPVSPFVDNPTQHLPQPERRSPTPLEYDSDSEFPPTLTAASAVPPARTRIDSHLDLQAADTAMETRANRENPGEDSMDMEESMPSIPYPTHSAPAAGITSTVTVDSGLSVRRSGRKRKEREDLGDISAALGACICGFAAAPGHESDYPNVARCKKEGCETKWYHLRCLKVGSVEQNWVCEPCKGLVEHSAGPSKRRRGAK